MFFTSKRNSATASYSNGENVLFARLVVPNMPPVLLCRLSGKKD